MNPGSPTPQAGILNQSSVIRTNLPTNQPNDKAIRRPQPNPKYKTQIDKTIEKAKIEGKQPNTIHNFYCKLRQLSIVAGLDNPEDVKKAISYAKLSNSSKTSFVLAYEWYTKTNGLKWEKPRFKWHLGIPIIPTASQVSIAPRIRSARLVVSLYETFFHKPYIVLIDMTIILRGKANFRHYLD